MPSNRKTLEPFEFESGFPKCLFCFDGAIIDLNCRVGKNARIEPNGHSEQDFDQTDVLIRNGIIVVPKGTVLADGWKL